jgi:hypothetical protein
VPAAHGRRIFILPRDNGGGSRTKCGGRGAGLDGLRIGGSCSAPTSQGHEFPLSFCTIVAPTSVLRTATSPLSRWRMKARAPLFARHAGARGESRATMSRNERPKEREGGRAPTGTTFLWPHRRQVYAVCANHLRGCGSVLSAARSPLGAPPRLSFRRPNATTQFRAALPGQRIVIKPLRALDPLRRRVQPDTWQTGRNAGRDDAQNRPGAECKSARRRRTRSAFRHAFRKAPFGERAATDVTITVTFVNITATTIYPVVPELVPGIPTDLARRGPRNRDGRDKPGHDKLEARPINKDRGR